MTSRRSAIRGVVLCLVFAAVSIGMILWLLAREGGVGPSAAPQASAAPRRTEVVPLADPGEPPRAELPAAPERVPTATETLELAAAAPQPTPGAILDLSPRTVFIEVQSQLGEREGFSVAGRVVLDELRPPLSAVVPDDGTVCCEGGDRLDRRWRVDDQGGLADVVVELLRDPYGREERRKWTLPPRVLDESGTYRVVDQRRTAFRVTVEEARVARRLPGPGAWRYPDVDESEYAKSIPLRIRCCRFEPRVLAVAPHSPVRIANEDERAHLDGLDAWLGPGACTFLDPGSATWPDPLELTSWLHPWMQAWIYVGESARPQVSGLDGRFELAAVSVDPVVLRLWHTELGTAEVVFQLPVPPPGRRPLVREWR